MLTVSFFVTGFLAAFKTEEMISPIFKSSRFGMISLKILGWWFIIVGFMYAAGFVVGMFRLLFD
jgi:hypothetical protein